MYVTKLAQGALVLPSPALVVLLLLLLLLLLVVVVIMTQETFPAVWYQEERAKGMRCRRVDVQSAPQTNNVTQS